MNRNIKLAEAGAIQCIRDKKTEDKFNRKYDPILYDFNDALMALQLIKSNAVNSIDFAQYEKTCTAE